MMPPTAFNKAYFDNYLDPGRPYAATLSEHLAGFAVMQADYGRVRLAGKSVVDLGCAMGHIVADLLKHGVEAYGVEISPYAFKRIPSRIRKRCRKADILAWLPQQPDAAYDILYANVLMYYPDARVRRLLRDARRVARHSLYIITPMADRPGWEPDTDIRVYYRSSRWWRGALAAAGYPSARCCASGHLLART